MVCLTSAMRLDESENARLEALILRLALGEVGAMGPIYDMTRSSVYAYALSLLKNSFDAEDMIHDSYMRLNASAGSYVPKGKPMAYLLTIVRNLCINRINDSKRSVALGEEDWERLLRADEIPANIEAAEWMSLLNDDERQIILLHAIAGFRHREIAGITGLPLSTVLSKYARALKKLRKHITEDGKGSGAV